MTQSMTGKMTKFKAAMGRVDMLGIPLAQEVAELARASAAAALAEQERMREEREKEEFQEWAEKFEKKHDTLLDVFKNHKQVSNHFSNNLLKDFNEIEKCQKNGPRPYLLEKERVL